MSGWMRRVAVAWVVGVAAAAAMSATASACTCLPVDLERDLPRVDGAFVGAVLGSSRRGQTETVYRFRVEQVYKGDIDSRIDVVSARDGAACGLELPEGERVGLLLERDGGVWRGSLCGQVDPADLLALTNVDDNTLPDINWGGWVVGFLILGAAVVALVRKRRRYSALR
jgi:hypothetical protein